MTIRAWYMDDDVVTDQRQPHRRDEHDVSRELLDSLGVLQWSGINGAEDPQLDKIKKDRGYTYTDIINVSPGKLEGYEQKIKNFFREHIHYDEEIRFCLDGSGYFDVRDKDDKWIRISVEKGDMIILPEGSYHRFTCDEKDYILAMRLFVGEPVWTPYNRDEIDEMKNESRLKYVAKFFGPDYVDSASNKRARFESDAQAVANQSGVPVESVLKVFQELVKMGRLSETQ